MITIWSNGDCTFGMPESLLVETRHKVQRHPWWSARAQLTVALLIQYGIKPPARVLDAGCGWGVTLNALEYAGYQATGCDISRRALELIDQPDRQLAVMDIRLAFPSEAGTYDAVLALDVIEHLENDQVPLRNLANVLRPGGLAVVSVPALPHLWSNYDEIQGHRRRYLPITLETAFRDTGLQIHRIFWWGAWMVPILSWTRRKEKNELETPTQSYSKYLDLPPWPFRWLMQLAFLLEKKRALQGKLRTGTSLFCVASQPKADKINDQLFAKI